MSHMNYGASDGDACGDACGGGARIVSYTATGAEGVSFLVDIGTTLAAADYHVGFFGASGAAVVPAVWDFPPASRTTTQFRVLIPDVLTMGDVFKFQIVEV